MPDASYVIIRGANEQAYNGSFAITYIDANSYSYQVAGSPATPATGTITATAQIVLGTTSAGGVASNTSFAYTADQPVIGKARRSTSAPFYKTGIIAGTITEDGLAATVFLVGDA